MSSKDGSVAPKERINIRYVPATRGQAAEMELPLKLVVVGDFKGHPEQTSLEERETAGIDKHSFDAVMEKAGLALALEVQNHLAAMPEATLPIRLHFASLNDFTPDAIAEQVPELRMLLELREALVALKGPLGNVPAFRSTLQQLLSDPAACDRLAAELQQPPAMPDLPAN